MENGAPSVGLGDCVMLVMSLQGGGRDTQGRALSQVSSILVNRFFIYFLFQENGGSRLKSVIFWLLFTY